jgi:hypothetical protein
MNQGFVKGVIVDTYRAFTFSQLSHWTLITLLRFLKKLTTYMDSPVYVPSVFSSTFQ